MGQVELSFCELKLSYEFESKSINNQMNLSTRQSLSEIN